MNTEKTIESTKANPYYSCTVNKDGEKTIIISEKNLRWLIVIISLAMFGAGRVITIYQYFP